MAVHVIRANDAEASAGCDQIEQIVKAAGCNAADWVQPVRSLIDGAAG